MKHPTLAELDGRMSAVWEAMCYLLALHYTKAELEGCVASYRCAAEQARHGEDGVVQLPHTAELMAKVSQIQDATADLFARALQLTSPSEGHEPSARTAHGVREPDQKTSLSPSHCPLGRA